MAVSTTMTEDDLKDYMHATLRSVADVLGWLPAHGDYDEPANDALLAVGVTTAASVSGIAAIRRLRAAARVEAWRAAMNETAGDYDFRREDGADFKRSQAHAQAAAMFAREQDKATALGVTAYQSQEQPFGSAKVDFNQGYYAGDST